MKASPSPTGSTRQYFGRNPVGQRGKAIRAEGSCPRYAAAFWSGLLLGELR